MNENDMNHIIENQNDLDENHNENKEQESLSEERSVNEKNLFTRKKLIKYTLIYLLASLIYLLMILFSKINRFKGEVTITDSLQPLKYVMILAAILGILGIVLIIIDTIKKDYIERFSISFRKTILTIVDWFSVLPICVVITVACFSYLFIITPVEGHSMEPTIKDGEHVFISYTVKVKAGSVVVLEVNENDNANVLGTSYYIKRVVGLPGDVIEWKDGQLYINGEAKDYLSQEVLDSFHITGADDFSKENTFYYENGEKVYPDQYIIPEGYYFVMGDNRNTGASHDSRRIGLIKEENIIGVATYHMNYIIPRGKIE